MALPTPILNELRAALGSDAVAADPATLTAYAYDGTWAEQRPAVVLHPTTTEQVSAILRVADRERIPIVPRGAATGLAGGAVPIAGSICLNLARMNRIISISAPDSIVIAQPGVVTVPVSLQVNDAPPIARNIRLYGPGDVTGIDPQCALRRE